MLDKRRKSGHEPESNPDRYLITYSDLITLLLGLFVILYAISQVDEGKYVKVSKAFAEYFKSDKGPVLQGGGGLLEGSKDAIPEPIIYSPAIRKSLQQIGSETEKALESLISKGLLKMKLTAAGLVITLPEKLLFESGKADIRADGQYVIDSLGVILAGVQYQISVDGHTDSSPIATAKYPSNWHLSTDRALTVGYSLIKQGAPESNLVVRGFGQQRPITDNSTTDNKAQNRRVEITIAEIPTNTASTTGYKADTLK